MIFFQDVKLGYALPVDKMLVWRNDPQIFNFTRQFTLLSPSQHRAYIEKIADDPTIKLFTVETLDNQVLGVCGFTSINYLNQNAEFSLYIAPEFQGKGYGKKALIALCTHGFKQFNFNRIWGETFEYNNAQFMFENIGFKKEGILRQSYFRNGNYIDSIIYSVLRKEWLHN